MKQTYKVKMNNNWIKSKATYLEEVDEFIELYKGWKIYFSIPNGGILGVGISNGEKAFYYASEFKEKKYTDQEWHLNLAKTFIDNNFCN